LQYEPKERPKIDDIVKILMEDDEWLFIYKFFFVILFDLFFYFVRLFILIVNSYFYLL
jgi:hypothetical protein